MLPHLPQFPEADRISTELASQSPPRTSAPALRRVARASLSRCITSEQQATPMSSLASVPKRETRSLSVRTTTPSAEHHVLTTMAVVWQDCAYSRAASTDALP